jgi:hypothetical protein
MGSDSRIALVRLGTDNRDYVRGLRDAEKATQTWGNRVKGHITKSLRGAFGGLGGITGLAGIAGFGAMARDVMKFNEGLVNLQTSAGKTRGEMLAFNRALQATAAATGAQQDELLAGAQKYTELTGRFDEFAASMDTFAKVSVATGASMKSLVATAAALSDNMGIKPEEMLPVFDVLTAQGKAGKIELKGMGEEFAALTSQFARFKSGAAGAAEMGAFMQTLAKGAPNAAEAATQLGAVMSTVTTQSEKFAKVGINVWADKAKTQFKDLETIMNEVVEKVPVSKLGDITDRKEFQLAVATYRAHREEFEKLNDTTKAGGMIMKDFAERSLEAPVKMAKAMAHFKAVFNEALMKNLDAIVSAFESLVKALSWMASHPEALAALAVLWKGGGFLGTLGGLGGRGGGGLGGGLGALAGGAGAGGSRMARLTGAAGGMMQGAAVGYALSQTGERLNNNFDTLSDAGMTAAGALVGLGGPLAALGIAIMSIKAATDWAIRDLDRRQQEAAASDLGATKYAEVAKAFGDLGSGTTREIVGANGQIQTIAGEFDPHAYLAMRQKMGLGVSEDQRAQAQFLLRRGKNQGFINESGMLDQAKLDAYLAKDKSAGPQQREQMRRSFLLSQALLGVDPETRAAFEGYGVNGMKPTSPAGPAVFGAGGLRPGGGSFLGSFMDSPMAQMALGAIGAPTVNPDFAAGQGRASYAPHEEIRIRIIPTDGISAVVENDTKNRRRGGR